jgi:hypothetical protein
MQRIPVYAAWLAAGLVTAFTIRYASFTAWGTDPASYVSAAHRWAAHDVFASDSFQMWSTPSSVGVPVGSRAGAIQGTYVPMYPLGFPVLLAVGVLADADLGVYLIAPVFAGILVLSAFALARSIVNDWAAVFAAALVALNPIAHVFTVTTMSDVPAAALVTLAVAMSVRPSMMAAAAAGASIAAAIMTRPILSPLTVVPLMLCFRGTRWSHAAVFVLVASIGPALLAWSQVVLYGGPLTSGYGETGTFFGAARVAVNARVYIGHLAAVSSPLVFFGLLCAVPLYYTLEERKPFILRVIIGLITLVVINVAVYLPYLTYEDIGYTRFLLPAQTALFVLLAVATAYACAGAAKRWKPLAVICTLPVVIVIYTNTQLMPLMMHPHVEQPHARTLGLYLRAVLPANAAVIAFLHSAGIAHYTGRQIVRFDLLPPGREAERFIERLLARGYHPVFVVDQDNEPAQYKMALGGTAYERLDWPARATAMIPGSSTVVYLDAADRDRSPDRIPPIDLLR